MIKWLEEELKRDKEQWTCESDVGNEILSRIAGGWDDYSEEEIIKLREAIMNFIDDKRYSEHDRNAVEGLSHGFFEYAAYKYEDD